MSKTALSLSGDPSLKGVPVDFKLPVSDIYLSAGAGFIVVMVGEVSCVIFSSALILDTCYCFISKVTSVNIMYFFIFICLLKRSMIVLYICMLYVIDQVDLILI